MARNSTLLSGYKSSLASKESRCRYEEKIRLAGGLDPYEIPVNAWVDDIDDWPGITHIHVGMYLIVSPSPYTGEALLNYKSLDCYERFLAGWVGSVLVTQTSDSSKKIVTAKAKKSFTQSQKGSKHVVGETLSENERKAAATVGLG